jgi:Fe-S-cluster-containing dehydrogenase component
LKNGRRRPEMKKWNMIIDVARCEDCNNCFLACKDEHVDNDFPPYTLSQPRHGQRWINITARERGVCPDIDVANFPLPCLHCDNAPCLRQAKNGAVYKTDDGIVIIDPQKARGQKDIVRSCPYGAIWWNEAQNTAQKCTLCVHLLNDGWKEPRCVQACPTGAMRIFKVEEAEMQRIIEQEKLEVFHPEYKTQPRVYYRNLFRYTKCFIAGSVAYAHNGITDCAEGAKVSLYKDSTRLAECLTDNYGDFKFDRLEENSGKYMIEAAYKDYGKKNLEVNLMLSLSAGVITFQT